MAPSNLKVPSLIGLRAFEATVRFKSMTRAADELCVTHSAISKQVQSLEKSLGLLLLRRLPRSIEPTEDGARLAQTLGTAFGLIESGIAQLNPSVLSVRCTASLMNRWLIPRLPDLKARFPGLNISLSVTTGEMNFVRDGIDIAIRNDRVPPDDDIIVKQLMREMIGPVCSPEFARQHNLKEIYDLRKTSLITNQSRLNAWNEWQSLVGWEGDIPFADQIYDHFFLTLQSAVSGLGVAVAPRYLVTDDIDAGRLVAPFGFVTGKHNVVVWLSPSARRRKDAVSFLKWLDDQAKATSSSWVE